MSTHICFAFSPHIRLMQPDDGAPETTAPTDYYYNYYPEGAYYYVTDAGDQE